MKKSRVFGGKCLELLATLDQESLSWRTCQMSFDWVDPPSLDRLPQSAIILNGKLYGLQILEHLTEGPGGFVLPTPTVNEAHNNPFTPSQWERAGSLNVEAAKMQGYTKDTIGKGFRLNPPFVEEMMGFPIGWTELKPLETQ